MGVMERGFNVSRDQKLLINKAKKARFFQDVSVRGLNTVQKYGSELSNLLNTLKNHGNINVCMLKLIDRSLVEAEINGVQYMETTIIIMIIF